VLNSAGRVDVTIEIDDGVTSLSGKTLSKLIHCFDVLTKTYNFNKHAQISKDAVNAHT